ncbi:PREDICTED: disease resistance protein RML1B-like [Camelina sativa]|uniref:Disease resistance protein RML1B-like n=1 Tax=Camelina sativa TaxID=90675 RepID=A0ABM0SZL1_CAMSA|nr:PREDICTED: disease resistance protein RML1B-like [Camelina sativa]
MASSSSSLYRTWQYRVFTSFHGPDVRKTFLSHLRKQFNCNGITMFDDQGIERSQTIANALTRAIKESRISIVVLSKNYASSGWCLNELVEILECKEDMGQIVMTVFYGVDPSDVRKQTGDFGMAFNETCTRKTEQDRQRWSQALNDVGNIAGEHLQNWDNEAIMIEKIARDVLDKLNATPSRDFDGMVGLEAHLREMESLLDLDNDEVKMVAISGPAGIGKTTLARALHDQLSNKFQLNCFVDNLRVSCHSGFDEYGLKLRLQEQFLSKVLNQSGMKIRHLGAIKENLSDQKVLIILDDVNNLKQLEGLANETTWFGPGSRIVVTTDNRELLQQHGINNTYHVGFPSRQEALLILCRYAFRLTSPHHGFKVLAERISELCGKLPLALRVVGLSLRGKKEEEWEDVVSRLETILDRDIEDVLRVGYEGLDENEQTLFLHIAVFFNNEDGDIMKAMFDDNNLDVKRGLKILVNRSLINICSLTGKIVMHKLLQQVARQAIRKQEPWKRQILMDPHEICDVLENETGTRAVSGILFDRYNIDEVSISENALKRMPNLQFLRVYQRRDNKMHIPEKMEFPRRLRLLHWESYPRKSLPPTFHPEYLVELKMRESQFEYLWQGTQPLRNLKKMDLLGSKNLKELPDLSNATNLEILELAKCINLQIIPTHMNLVSLVRVSMVGCFRLIDIPVMSTNIEELYITETAVENEPRTIRLCSRLKVLNLSRSIKLNAITHLPKSVTYLDVSYSGIEKIPECIKALHRLQFLKLSSCKRLTSLPELPCSLQFLFADDCESLVTVFSPLNITPYACRLDFTNCFKLDQQQARRAIIQQSFSPGGGVTLLPGRQVPEEFDHRAKGNSLTVRSNGNDPLSRFNVCVVICPTRQEHGLGGGHSHQLLCRHVAKGDLYPTEISIFVGDVPKFRREHLFIFTIHHRSTCIDSSDVNREIVFEFSSELQELDIIECGAQILTDKWDYEFGMYQDDDVEFESSEASEDDIGYESSGVSEDDTEQDDSVEDEYLRTDCWSWLFLCFDLSQFVKNVGSLISGRRRSNPDTMYN